MLGLLLLLKVLQIYGAERFQLPNKETPFILSEKEFK